MDETVLAEKPRDELASPSTEPAPTVIDWQPIGTAPKDGSWLMALVPCSVQDSALPKPFVFTTRWVKEEWEQWKHTDSSTMKLRVVDASHWDGYEDPTHWAPLPGLVP